MRMQTFFQILCFVLFYLCLSRLIRSRNSVQNETFYDDLEDSNHLSICIKIDPKQFDCDQLNESDSLQICGKLRSYFEYILSEQPKSPRDILHNYDELRLPTLFEFNINATDLMRYLNAKHICFLYKLNVNPNLEKPDQPFFLVKVINKFQLSSKFFIHGVAVPRFYGRVEELKCENFISCTYFSVTVRQFRNRLLPAPFDTDCVTHSREAYEFKKFELIDVRSACISEFVKRRHRLFSFFYTKADNETIVYVPGRIPIDPQLVSQSKQRCKVECHELLFTFLEIHYVVDPEEQDYFGIQISTRKFNSIATPLLSATDFWINFFALISLFFKVSLTSIIFRLKRLLDSSENRMAIAMLTILFWTTLILSFFFGYYQGACMYTNYYVNSTLQNFVYRVAPFEPAEFNAAVCRKVNLENLQNLSLFEIEKEASNFNLTIWLKFDEEVTQIKTFVFKMFLKKSVRQYLEQCFLVEVKIDELRYRSMLSMTSLVINSTSFSHIYLGTYGKRITPSSKLFSRLKNIARSEIIDVVNCRDYRPHEDGCDSQDNCIDNCIIQSHLVSTRKLPFGSMIYADSFEPFEKRSLFFDYKSQVNRTIAINCKAKFPLKDCRKFNFISNFNESEYTEKNESGSFVISLFFEQIKMGTTFKFSIFHLIFQFALLYTSIIGISFPQILNFLTKLINSVLKSEDRLSPKNLIFLCSLIAATLHSYYLVQEIFFSNLYINIDLQMNYLRSNERIPNLLFCLKHGLTFRKNEFVTGHRLDQRTRHLNETYLFKEILYYDLNATKRVWSPENQETTENFQFSKFFLLNYKCLELRYRMNSENFKNGNILTILELRFNNISEGFLFSSQLNGTGDLGDDYWLGTGETCRIYFQYLKVVRTESYEVLQNPRLLFETGYRINDHTLFINQLKEQFRDNFNFSTKLIPLTEDFFHLQINDKIFDQFNKQYIGLNSRKTQAISLNYERTFFFSKKYSPSKQNDRNSGGVLSIDKVYYAYYVSFTNRSEFVVNLLNLVFLWFNFYIGELLHLLASFASFFLLFKPQNIRKLAMKLKASIDRHFVERKYLAPINSLNNLSLNSAGNSESIDFADETVRQAGE